jgi:hypothetical protein
MNGFFRLFASPSVSEILRTDSTDYESTGGFFFAGKTYNGAYQGKFREIKKVEK